jgi:chromate reductase
MSKTIGLIAGSLRKASFSKKIAAALLAMAPDGYTFTIISLDNLPVYNQDFDDDNTVPESYTSFRKTIQGIDGFIFITPEHNRSIPAVLKNAIDIGSRPYGKSVWDGKPAAIFSNSPGNISGYGANHHLRQCFVFLNIPVMQQPEVYIHGVDKLFDEEGNIKNKDTKALLEKAVGAYIKWFEKNAG